MHTKFGNPGSHSYRDMMYLITIGVKTYEFFKKYEKLPKNWQFKNPRNMVVDYTTRKLPAKFGNRRPNTRVSYR